MWKRKEKQDNADALRKETILTPEQRHSGEQSRAEEGHVGQEKGR